MHWDKTHVKLDLGPRNLLSEGLWCGAMRSTVHSSPCWSRFPIPCCTLPSPLSFPSYSALPVQRALSFFYSILESIVFPGSFPVTFTLNPMNRSRLTGSSLFPLCGSWVGTAIFLLSFISLERLKKNPPRYKTALRLRCGLHT